MKSDFKVQFHTYALEEERKIKVVIRGIPADFPVEEIKADLCDQGFPVLSVHRLCRRDGTPLWLVLAVLPRTEEAKNLSRTLNKVCGLSGIRVEAPHKKGGPGQYHRCQIYGHASANCNANPRCVKCLVPHWTRDCPLSRDSEEKPSCVNCGQTHTANYRVCPKAAKFISKNRPNTKRPSYAPAPFRNLVNFPALASKRQLRLSTSTPPPRSPINPWTKARTQQPPSATPRPLREAQRPPPRAAVAGIRYRSFIVVWRRYPNGDGRSSCGIEFGNIRIRGSTPNL
ncbi:Nucleic-acid-binding protein from transposon X-element [Eumeta japonica]|uniref:Nucleic-acid-binding protein from transposon X-element n=1 Tax=Eumeta variegata TaxID=151549 RepID=A0A4C1Y4F6_EUMVA|nr:Nucleic-acid-binding protein from transposon X-element [Eumeta japonica]